MNDARDSYTFFRKLLRLTREDAIEDTPEYQAFYQRFPHITTSIRLTRERDRLHQQIRSVEKGAARHHLNQDLFEINEQLARENLLKRLHGETRQETRFRIRLALEQTEERVSSLRSSVNRTYRAALNKMSGSRRSANQKINRFLRRTLPPTVFDLGSMDMQEKGLAVREWVVRNQESPQSDENTEVN